MEKRREERGGGEEGSWHEAWSEEVTGVERVMDMVGSRIDLQGKRGRERQKVGGNGQ